MSTQKTLFDHPLDQLIAQHQIARHDDPATSHVAAAEAQPKLNSCKRQFLQALRQLGAPSTAHEIAAKAADTFGSAMRETYRKRALELVRSGYLAEAGSRACSITGKAATLYWLTEL